MAYPTADIDIQTNVEENVQVDYIIKEVVEATMQTDPAETQDAEVQTNEIPLYTPLVIEVVIRKL